MILIALSLKYESQALSQYAPTLCVFSPIAMRTLTPPVASNHPLAASSNSETVTILYPLRLSSGSTCLSMGIVQLLRS